MNTIVIIIGIIILIFIWWNFWVSIQIVKYIKRKGEKVRLFKNFLFVKGKIFKYLPVYKKLTIQENDKVGQLYYYFYLSFILSMFFLGFGILMVFLT